MRRKVLPPLVLCCAIAFPLDFLYPSSLNAAADALPPSNSLRGQGPSPPTDFPAPVRPAASSGGRRTAALSGASYTKCILSSPRERVYPDAVYYPYVVIPGRTVPLRAWKEIWADNGTPGTADDTEQDMEYIPSDSASLAWESDDPGVCEVSAGGVLTTVAAGECTVTCTYTGTGEEGTLVHELPVSVIPLDEATMDLDVLFIERLRKTGEGEWAKFERNTDHAVPRAGETVIYRAYVVNMGERASGPFNARWKVDGTEVAAEYVADLDVAGEMVPSGRYLPDPDHLYYPSDVELLHHRNEMALDLERVWSDGREEIELTLEPFPGVTDSNADNNTLLTWSDALCFTYFHHEDNYLGITHVQQVDKPFLAFYMQRLKDQTSWGEAETAVRSSSAYDCLQRYMRVINAQFGDSKSPILPDGISERVRVEAWVVERDVMRYAGLNCWKLGELDKAADIIWGWESPRSFWYYKDPVIDGDWCTLGGGQWVDYPMIHEISHARYLGDDYNYWLTNNEIELTDGEGQRAFPLDMGNAFDLERHWNHWQDPQWIVKGLYRGNMMQGAYWNGWSQQNAVGWERMRGIRWPDRCANSWEPRFDAYCEFSEDGAEGNWVRIVGPGGAPVEGAVVEVHMLHPERGTVTDQVDIEAITDAQGFADLGPNPLSVPDEYYFVPHTQPDEYYRYHPRHWWGSDHAVIRIRHGGKSFYKFIANQDLNLAFWSRCGWEAVRGLILDGFYPNSPDPAYYPDELRPTAGSTAVLAYTIDPLWSAAQEEANRDEVPQFADTGVYVTVPSHGDVVSGGGSAEIAWDAVGATGAEVSLHRSLDGGVTWEEIDPGTAKPNSGSYVWAVPDVHAAFCKVRVVPSGHEAYGGSSGGFFLILPSYPTATPTATPTITPTPGPTAPPTAFPSSVKVDDKNDAVVYGGTGWANWNDAADYLGSEMNSHNAAACAEFSFAGTGIRWIGSLDANLGKADVYLDGALDAADVDCYMPTPKKPQRILYGRGNLAPTGHTVKVVVKQAKNPLSADYYVVIDAFEYNALPTPTGPTPTRTPTRTPTPTVTPTPTAFPRSVKVDDKNASVLYRVGGWGNWSEAGDYCGSETNSAVVNAYAEFSFIGTGIRWIGTRDANLGKADVYLDGVLEAAGVDCYKASPKAFQQKLYGRGGLSAGPHTIRVAVAHEKNPQSNNYYVVVDAFEYNAAPTPTPTPTATRTPTITPTPTPTPRKINFQPTTASTPYGFTRMDAGVAYTDPPGWGWQ